MVIFLPYVSKASSWCKGRLVGRCLRGPVCGASARLPETRGAWEGPGHRDGQASLHTPCPGQLLLLARPQAPKSPQLTAWSSSLSTCTNLSARSGWRPSATGSTPLWPRSSSWTSGKAQARGRASAAPVSSPAAAPGPLAPWGEGPAPGAGPPCWGPGVHTRPLPAGLPPPQLPHPPSAHPALHRVLLPFALLRF